MIDIVKENEILRAEVIRLCGEIEKVRAESSGERTMVVAGNECLVVFRDSHESIGSLAHQALWNERLAWTEFELRDRGGNRLVPSARHGSVNWPVYVSLRPGVGG